MPLLKHPWNTLSPPGALALFAIHFSDALEEFNEELQHHGGLGHTAWSDHRPKLAREGFSSVTAWRRGFWDDLCAPRQQSARCPTVRRDYFWPPVRRSPLPAECHLTVLGMWDLSGAESRAHTGFPKFLEWRGVNTDRFSSLSQPCWNEKVSAEYSDTKCSALIMTCLPCFSHLLAKW